MTDEELEALPVIGAADAARSDIKEDDLESLPIIEDDDIESLPIIEDDDLESLPIIEDEPKTQQKPKAQKPTQDQTAADPEKLAAETEKKPTIGLNEMAGLSYEAQTGVDAPENAVGKHVVNVFGFAGKNLANAQMNAAQALIDGSERNDADTNRILSRMLYGDIGGTVASWFSVPDVLEEWDAGEGQRYTDKGERTKARNAFAAGIANQFIADRMRTQQDAQNELQTREKTFGAETMSDLENTAGYMVPFAMGPVGIAAQFLTGAIGNAEGLANDQYGFDNDGNLIVTAKGDDANTAAAKGIISSAIETGAEVIGGKLAGKVVGGVGKKLAEMTVGKFPIVEEVAGKLVATPIGQTVAKAATALNKLKGWASRKLHIEGLGEEYIEEWLDPTLNAVMGSDTRDAEQIQDPGARVWEAQKDFFTVDNQQRLITSLIILQGAGNLIAYCAERKRMNVVDDYLLKNGLMTDEEISEKSPEEKAQAMNEYVASLSEGKLAEILNRTAGMADGAAASIADEVTKPKEFTPEQNIALDETIPQFVGANETLFQRVKERIREKLTTGQLGSAQASGVVDQLDDPKQREDLVMRTVEEILHEDNMAEIDRTVNVKTVGFGWQDVSGKLDEAMPRTADTVTSGYAGRIAAANPQMDAERVWEIAGYVAANEATSPELRTQLEQGKTGIEEIEKLMSEDGAGIVPVEQPDGSFKTVNEVEAEAARVKPEKPENQEQPTEGDKSLQWAAVPGKDNVWHTPEFPDVEIAIQDDPVAKAEPGKAPGKIMFIENLPEPSALDENGQMKLGKFLVDQLDIATKAGIKEINIGKTPEDAAKYSELVDKYEAKVSGDKFQARSDGVLGVLKKSGLATEVVATEAEFNAKLEQEGYAMRATDGRTYGFTDGQNVYLNPAFFRTREGLNTPIHEFGHLGIEATKKINRPLYDRGVELIKQTGLFKEVSEHPDYASGSEEARATEALTRLIAARGENLEANTPKGVIAEIKKWLVEFWKSFGQSLGIRDLTPEQIAKMTVEDVADAIRAEMMSGREFGTRELSLQEGDLKAKILRFAKYQKPTSKNAKAALDAAKKAWKGLSEEQKTALGQYGDTAVLKTPEARTIANGVRTLREWDARRDKISEQVKKQIRKSPNEAQKKFITSSPKYYISEVTGDATSPFAYAVEKGLPIPRKGDWGWDAWERLTDGMKYKERRKLEKILGGEHPERGGMDTVLSDYAQWLGISWDEGARDFEHGRGIEDFLDDILKERERFEKWRSGDRMTRSEAEAESAAANERPGGMTDAEFAEEDAWVKAAEARRVEAERMGEQDGNYETIPFSRAPLQFAIGKKENDSWINAVDDYVSGKIAPRTDVTVLPRVPTVISRVLNDVFGIGTEGKEIIISSDSIKKAMIGKHRIGADEMKKLAVSLDAPLAVFQSKTRPMDSITALIPIRDANGGISSIVPIDYTAKTSNGKLTLRITSVYGKTSAEAVQEWIDNGYLLYADRKNISRSFPHRLQLPGRTKTANRFLDENDFSEEALGIVSNPVDNGNGAVVSQTAPLQFSRSGLYTGSAADYEKPSLLKVGTGEGSQVYGWGLYASSVRGVAESYTDSSYDKNTWARNYLNLQHGDRTAAIKQLKYAAKYVNGDARTAALEAAELISSGKPIPKTGNIYEQTFFTDRAPGDESHLLKWYEPVSEEQAEWILDALKDMGSNESLIDFVNGERKKDLDLDGLTWRDVEGEDAAPDYYPDDVLRDYLEQYLDLAATGGEVYGQLSEALGSPKAASEFLARAGIDGIKYPVDSYGGKTVKDGEKAGWNYVSFRDDNIRVDHKWRDGEMLFSRGSRAVFVGGRTRVADDGGQGEQTPGGLAASHELNTQAPTPISQAGRILPMSLPVSELEWLRKKLTGDALPAHVARRMPLGKYSGSTRTGKIIIAADVFGTVDRTDMEKEKNTLKAHGFFRNEDPSWAIGQSHVQIRRERIRSEEQLAIQLLNLSDRRVRGIEDGGQAAARGIFAHELAKVVMSMPRTGTGVIGRVQRIGDGIRGEINSMVAASGGNSAGAEALMRGEAGQFLDWAYGGPLVDPVTGATVSRGQGQSLKELTDEMFGAFLTMPQQMQGRAQAWYDAILKTIANTPKLADAFRELSVRGVTTQAHSHVLEAIKKSHSLETERRLQQIWNEINEPISAGDAKKDLEEKIVTGFHDKLGIVNLRINWKIKEYKRAQDEIIRQLRAQGAPKSAIAAVQMQIDLFTQGMNDKLNKLELSRTAFERGAANEGMRYIIRMHILEQKASERWGLSEDDRITYLDMMRVIETQGRAGTRGISGRQASLILGDMARRLGAEKWMRLQQYGREFHAIIEQEFLGQQSVVQMVGQGFVDYMRTQTSYVATKRVQSPEELDAIDQARAAAVAAGVNGGDSVISQIYAYMGKNGGSRIGGEGLWNAKLVGSFADKQEVRSATWEKHEILMQIARKNQFIIDMRNALLTAKVEGVRDIPRHISDVPNGERYGMLPYMENGKKRTLIVPKQISDAFKREDNKTIRFLMKTNEFFRNLYIDWNLGYSPIDMARNLASIQKNMEGMHESPVKTALRPVSAGLVYLGDVVSTELAAHSKGMSEIAAKVPGWNGTTLPFAYDAHKIVRFILDPDAWQRELWDAEDRGDVEKAAQLYQTLNKAMEVLSANMFVSFRARTTGKATEGFANDFMNRHGLAKIDKINSSTKKSIYRRAVESKWNLVAKNRRRIEYNDMFAKTMAYLHDRENYAMKRDVRESGVEVKKSVGLGEVERRGYHSNFVQVTVNQFFNAIEKGIVQHARAIAKRPVGTLTKDGLALGGLFLAGLAKCGVLQKMILSMFDDDEEKIKGSEAEGLYNYLKDYNRAYLNCSDYTRENYNITPLWNSPDGYTSIVLAMPQDDQEKLFGWLADYCAQTVAIENGIPVSRDNFFHAFGKSLIKQMAPDVSLTTGFWDIAKLALSLFDETPPEDSFRNAPIIDRDTWNMRFESIPDGANFALAAGKYLWNAGGGRSIYQFPYNGVDKGNGDAPKWIGLATQRIPFLSPALKRFVKIQVGSAERDAKPLSDELKRYNNIVSHCVNQLVRESAVCESRLNDCDSKKYDELLTTWQERYELSDGAMRTIEKQFLNIWKGIENMEVSEQKRIKRQCKDFNWLASEEAQELFAEFEL